MGDFGTPYFDQFGRFINQFTNVEAVIHALFRHMTTLPDEQARVICGGMRLKDVIEIIKRLARAKKIPIKTRDLLDMIFSHFNEIVGLRDKLVHRGVSISAEEIVSSNARTVRFREDTEILRLKVPDLGAATLDLGQIFIWILQIMHPMPGLEPEPAREPWLYKPLKPETPYQRSHKVPQLPKRRGAASRGR
jgi:hypothetical protein